VGALFTTLAATGQTDAPDAPDAEGTHPFTDSQGEPASQVDAKKLAKYDVARIGRRGIGKGFNLYSARRERQLGESLAATFDRSMRLVKDREVTDYINRLGQAIVRNSDAEVAFTIKIIDSGDVPRAYGLPGGFLYVDSALILAADSEAELAAVMAHEIAHVAARHATRSLTRKQVSHFATSLSLLAGPAGVALEDVGGIAGPLSVKKFNRDSEYEADLLGIEYSYSAGYDPEALLAALEKLHVIEARRAAAMAKIPGYHLVSRLPFHDKVAQGFSNYPLTEDRIRRLQAEMSTFLPDRKDYILDTNEFQEMKSRLLASQGLLQLRRSKGDDEHKGPVLRRAPEDTDSAEGNPLTLSTLLP
jgi:predicted Zn-dependent protease